MAKVKNWQIKREMEYRYEGKRPRKQWCIVFDLNKCIACQTCSLACKTTWTSGKGEEYMFWNNVETKPWGSYPLGWDVRLLEKMGQSVWNRSGVLESGTIFESAAKSEVTTHFKPQEMDWMYPNHGEDDCTGNVTSGCHLQMPHNNWFFYLPRTCAHCTYPACLASCPRKAIYKREEDGIVLIDLSRCKGYGECVRSCPYKKSMYNSYTRVSQKCVGCYPAVEKGLQPMCVQNCIGKIRIMGFISPPDHARPNNPVDYLVHTKKLALPLYPQLGLEPNIYYIPPMHADRTFLRQMFGGGVDQAISAYRDIKSDALALGLLVLMGSTERIIHSFSVKDKTAIAFDEKGREIVRVPVTEPVLERAGWDARRGVARTNTP